MDAKPTGPLFDWPHGAHGVSWLDVLPLLLALPAALLLVQGLVRGRLPQPSAAAGIIFFPVAAYALGFLLLMERSKQVSFCGSCHVMTPILQSLSQGDGSLASIHYMRGRVSHEDACFICHSGYGIWGTVGAKMAGVRHMIHTVTGNYERPITLNGPFDIDSCLGCHARAENFRAVEAHQDRELQDALVSRQMSCTGVCHPAPHPAEALTGGAPAS